VRTAWLILALAVAACAAPATQVATASPTAFPSDLGATASPSSSPTPEPSASATPPARTIDVVGGIEFAMITGPADLRLETAISRPDEAVIASSVAADVEAVQRDFARSFTARPLVYVFATSEGYARGLARVFGYSTATAAFVADNSVSFFEPSLLAIAVNWQAIGDRRPVAAIRHELTHRLTLDACAPRCDLVPAWFNEGEARLAEALVPGSDWRMVRVRYEAASMAATNTLIPLNTLVSQLTWNSLTDWAGYYKYQEAARATELLREDVGGDAPIARIYERIRRGENLAQAYAALAGRSFDEFVAGLGERMRAAVPPAPGMITLPLAPEGSGSSYLLYGFAPTTTVTLTISGPRGSETSPVTISPFGAVFDGLPATRSPGGYTLSIQHPGGVITAKVRKEGRGAPGDTR